MKIALLVPCRDGAAYLPRLFASAAGQTRHFDEVWLFDDASTDGSSDVARRFGAQVVRSEQRVGPSVARNRLSVACACDWLHFHDADDTMEPRYAERVAEFAKPDTDVVVCNMLWVDEESGATEHRWVYDAAEFARDPASYLLTNTIGGINGFYRRDTLLAAGGFDETLTFWEDMDLNLRLSQRGARAAVVDECLVTAYRRRNSYSNSNLGEVWRVKLRIMERLLSVANSELRATIATEAEVIAGRFASLELWDEIPAALALARQAGGNPPTTQNPILWAMKLLAPASWTFRLQSSFRRHMAR